jgi:hypothetical protein
MLNSVAENNTAMYNSPADSSPANKVFGNFKIPTSAQFDNGMEIPNMKGEIKSSPLGPVAENAFMIPSPTALKQTERPVVNNAFLKLKSFISCHEIWLPTV